MNTTGTTTDISELLGVTENAVPTRPHRTSRVAKLLMLGVLLVTLAGAISVEAAGAARLSSNGTIGYVGLPSAKCTYFPSWKRLDVNVPSPTIYAPNVRAGGGNDAAWTRYQVFIIDSSRNVVQWSNPSGWALSYDNQAASFTGSASFTSIPNYSTVYIWVEWYGAGSAVYKVDNHQIYVSGLTYPYGPADSCSKYTPPGYVSF